MWLTVQLYSLPTYLCIHPTSPPEKNVCWLAISCQLTTCGVITGVGMHVTSFDSIGNITLKESREGAISITSDLVFQWSLSRTMYVIHLNVVFLFNMVLIQTNNAQWRICHFVWNTCKLTSMVLAFKYLYLCQITQTTTFQIIHATYNVQQFKVCY